MGGRWKSGLVGMEGVGEGEEVGEGRWRGWRSGLVWMGGVGEGEECSYRPPCPLTIPSHPFSP